MQLKPLNLILFGPPGAGKSTQAQFLGKLTAIDAISTGQRLRDTVEAQSEIGKEVASVMAAGKLVNDELMERLLREWIAHIPPDVGMLLDGYPRTLKQAHSLEHLCTEIKRPIDTVIALAITDETAIHRLSGRRICRVPGQPDAIIHVDDTKAIEECLAAGGKLIEREDDKPATIRRRMAEYNKKTEPLLHYYGKRDKLIIVDADESPEEVAHTIESILIKQFTHSTQQDGINRATLLK